MTSAFFSRIKNIRHKTSTTLNEINSTSYLNNVAMKYRFDTTEISKMLSRIVSYNTKSDTNLFERIKCCPGAHLDKDLKYSRSIIQQIKKQNLNKTNQDKENMNNGYSNKNLMKNKETIQSDTNDRLLSSSKHKANFFRKSSLLKITNDSYDEFVAELNKEDNQKAYQSNDNPSNLKDNIFGKSKRGMSSRSFKSLLVKEKKTNRIKPESLIKTPKKVNLDSELLNHITIQIPKIEDKQLFLNKNCTKMKTNLNKEKEIPKLMLNTNYTKKEGKNGTELFLDYYLTPVSNKTSTIELTPSLVNKEMQHPCISSSSSILPAKEKYIGSSAIDFYKHQKSKIKMSPIKQQANKMNMTGFSTNRLYKNREAKDILLSHQMRKLSNNGFNFMIKTKEEQDQNEIKSVLETIDLISKKIYQRLDKCKGNFFLKVDTIRNLNNNYSNDSKRKRSNIE